MRIKPWIAIAIVSATLLPAGAAATQITEEEILIRGQSRKEGQRQARSYIKELGVAVGERQTARWFDPVCPRAIGLSSVHAAIVEGQLRQVIRRARAPLAPAACEPNMLVAFTDGPKPVLRHISRKSSALQQVATPYVHKLKQGDAPIRWWYITETRSRDGTAADTLDTSSGAPLLRVPNSSHISTQAVRAITTATVIVDVDAAEGTPLKSVVDYAALVALAEIKGEASPPNSILSLFDAPSAPRELTRRDTSFLNGLYRIHMDRRADQQQRTLVGQMVKETAAN